MSDEWNGTEKRKRKSLRESQLGVGIGIGTPTAAILAWYISLRGVQMPPGVEAAMGSIITAFILCLEDLLQIIKRVVIAKLKIK